MMTDGEVPLYYEIHGAGPPLLLIAGLASDSRSWQPVLSGLKQNHTLILMDNRGVGRSCQEVKTSIGLMADDAYALVRDLGFDRVNVLGHSMGGMVAMSYALRYPDALDRLLLVSTACQNSARNNVLFSDWAAWFAEGKNRQLGFEPYSLGFSLKNFFRIHSRWIWLFNGCSMIPGRNCHRLSDARSKRSHVGMLHTNWFGLRRQHTS
jgi:pimeloyl-ACP methyl ester carboxylesterase